MSKLSLKMKVVSVLNQEQQSSIKGGNMEEAGTTSYSNCTGFLCCSQKPCVPASEGAGITCNMNPDCKSMAGGAPNCTGPS